MTAAGSTILLLVGTVLLRLTVSGTYRRYVRVGMGPWLAVAGVTVVVLGVVTLIYVLRRPGAPADHADHADDADHADHAATEDADEIDDRVHPDRIRIGWLLLAPIAALLLVAPPTLGSFGVSRSAAVNVHAGGAVFDPLPHGTGPVPMTLLEYGQRAFDRHGSSLAGATVELTGFISRLDNGGFQLARYQIACCAADAVPAIVIVEGVAGHPPRRDAWVKVTGAYVRGTGDLPRFSATSVLEIPVPNEPYE
jgi:uncharacterized repeat protein (TIGR03943 family)